LVAQMTLVKYRVKSEEERRNASVTTVVIPGKVSKAPPKWWRDVSKAPPKR
jgi:hypothetical protein